MADNQAKALLKFQQQQQSLILSTLDRNGNPSSSYAPFVTDDLFTYWVFVSGLASHTMNLQRHPQAGIMLLEDESTASNLYARKRFTLTCNVHHTARDDPAWNHTLDQFEQRFGPVIRTLRQLADFQLIRLQAQQGLWVSGFGKAFQVSNDPFQISEVLTGDSNQRPLEPVRGQNKR